jgi:putative transposase
MQNGICEAFNRRMRDELLNETIFYDLDYARAALARGLPPTTKSARIRRSASSPPRPSREHLPQQAIGCATPTTSAARLLLRRRRCVNLNPRL